MMVKFFDVVCLKDRFIGGKVVLYPAGYSKTIVNIFIQQSVLHIQYSDYKLRYLSLSIYGKITPIIEDNKVSFNMLKGGSMILYDAIS
jgi:hypothetical protein